MYYGRNMLRAGTLRGVRMLSCDSIGVLRQPCHRQPTLLFHRG
jgi:hypothetical protein